MLNQCLTEVKSDYQIEADLGKVFFIARVELISLKRKEYELAHKSSYLEVEYGKLMEQLGKAKKQLRCWIQRSWGSIRKLNNRRHWLLIQKSLTWLWPKLSHWFSNLTRWSKWLLRKKNELGKCLIEVQEKSTILEDANSLKGALLQRDVVLKKCEKVWSCYQKL